MKTISVNLYSFSELSEEAKNKAIEKLWDLNVDRDWWDGVYDNAENIGLKITGFDIDRGSYCSGDLMHSAYEVANKIVKEHGETCETYKTAKEFINEWDQLVEKYSDGVDLSRVSEDNEYQFDQDAEDLEGEFEKSLLEDYRIILSKEYEYLTGREAIIEMIEANEYEFTEAGDLY